MLKPIANAALALSLMLSASVSAPAHAGKPHDPKCTMAKHKHAKRAPAGTKSKGGVMLVEKRKLDVQILSFGP